MLKELHVVEFSRTSENIIEKVAVEPSLLSFSTLIKARRSLIPLGSLKNEVVENCPDSIVGNFLTVFEMSNGKNIYIAEDYDWIRKHCSD